MLEMYLTPGRAGNWISEPSRPQTSFEDFVTTIPPGAEKVMFLRFIRKLLTWDPILRATSAEVIGDEWLMMAPDSDVS